MSTITLLITRNGCEEGVYLYLPSTPAEIGEAFSLLDMASEDVDSTRIFDVISPVGNLPQYIRNVDANQPENIRKLNTLAEMIEDMDERQRNTLWGALDGESINGLDDVLKVAKHLDQYVFLPNIMTDTELGRILVDTGYKDFPESVQPYLDYRAIGSEYYADHGGAFTPLGYVKRKEPSQEHRDALITVHFRTLEAPGIAGKTCRLPLPATEEELDAAKERLGVDHFTEAAIDKIEFGQP